MHIMSNLCPGVFIGDVVSRKIFETFQETMGCEFVLAWGPSPMPRLCHIKTKPEFFEMAGGVDSPTC